MAENFRHIVRIANVDLPGEKQLRWGLTQIKGIGINLADAVCIAAKVPKLSRTGELSEQAVAAINAVIADPLKNGIPVWMLNRRKDYESNADRHLLLGTLSFARDNDIKRMKQIRSYRGIRHGKGLPVRGQRTRSNFRRSKGKVVGVVKKKAVAAQAAPAKEEKKK